MTSLLRFSDLQARNIVKSWPQLRRLQKLHGFPLGRMLSPNIRTWTDDEIDEWYASRPVEGPEPRGEAKKRRDARLLGPPPTVAEGAVAGEGVGRTPTPPEPDKPERRSGTEARARQGPRSERAPDNTSTTTA